MTVPIAPIISVGLLLFLLFTMNRRIATPIATFHSNLPFRSPALTADDVVSDLKINLLSDREGNLTDIKLGSKSLGNDEAAFERLNKEILRLVGRPGNPLTSEIQVEIDADYETQYQYIAKAVSKCTGGYDPSSKQIARYVDKIKFAPPRKPKE